MSGRRFVCAAIRAADGSLLLGALAAASPQPGAPGPSSTSSSQPDELELQTESEEDVMQAFWGYVNAGRRMGVDMDGGLAEIERLDGLPLSAPAAPQPGAETEAVGEVMSVHVGGVERGAFTASMFVSPETYWESPVKQGDKLYTHPPAPAVSQGLSDEARDDLIYRLLMDLSGVDVHDTNLRDTSEAYTAVYHFLDALAVAGSQR